MACSELPTTPEDLFQILSRRLTQEEYEGYTTDDGFGNQYPYVVISTLLPVVPNSHI